ncbi:RNA polymerase sigma factor [Alteromonas sp. a30]|uniref:RNA polymerase sigma factor n=1 Tax=Alteromonas sp. a30 TaxID=2730917 RepID=UPI0022812BD7|nr:sigma-70 family RNA polymerase sigma factor [Alteromonas sp. a30]MCY7296492.1 sigma-70 family RNA polymerase sigma factor [Alteromonas sp. a30]
MSISLVSITQSNAVEQQFNQIWTENQFKVRNFCLRWLSGRSDMVDDVMSLTAEKAYKYLSNSGEPIHNPLAWLCTMTRNICADIYRAEVKERELVNQVNAAPNTFFFASNQSEPLEQMIEREADFNSLLDDISLLPKEHQEVLALRVFEGLDYQEMSSRTQLTAVNLRKRVQIMRKQLRQRHFN